MSIRSIYILRGLRWHRARFLLVVMFVMFGLLLLQLNAALNNVFSTSGQVELDNRLLVVNGTSPQMSLPALYTERMLTIDDVAAVTHATWVGSYFRHPSWIVPAIAVDSASFFPLNPSLNVTPEQIAQWRNVRNGVLVDQRFAEQYQLQVGDRLPLQSSIWQLDNGGVLDLRIVGLVSDSKPENRPGLYLHYDFFDSNRLSGKGLTSYFMVEPNPQADAAAVSQRIDASFADDPQRGITSTAPVQIHMRQFAARLFDIGRGIGFVSISICILLTVLLTANFYVIAQKSLPDYIIFRRLGFSRRWVLVTVFLQLSSCVASGLILSIVLGVGALHMATHIIPSGLADIYLSGKDYLLLFLVGIALTLICTAPALGRLTSKGFFQ